MKRNIKFFTIVISLLLLSSIILTGCMYAIIADNGEMKPYDLNGQKQNSPNVGDNIVEDAPTAQAPLRGKFQEYIHQEGKTVTVFSEEQYTELKAIRDSGKRTPLTYEEILFLVNDSINLYFTYEEIILPNANRDNVIPLLTNQSGNARVIYPEYKDASAYKTYSEAETAYYKMLTDIYEIIYYRIYMHDAGFEMVHHTYHSGKDNIFGNRYNGNLGMISSAVQVGSYQMLAIDDSTFSGVENEKKLVGEYKTLLEWKRMYEADAIIDYEHYPYLNSPVLYTSIWNTNRETMKYKFYIVGPKDDPAQQIYPTTELENMMPRQELGYEAKYNEFEPVFSLNYATGKFAMSSHKYFSFALIGKFDEHDGVLKLYPENAGDNVYSYVFRQSNDGYVYSAADSKPLELAGFNWKDGLVFEKVHEGASTNPNPDPPVNNTNQNKTETPYSNPYFKLDLASNICSLMSPEGNPHADGTYVQEGDTYILSFDGDYQYVIRYYKNIGYEYDKAQSNPIPGYEFESGTLFNYDDGIFTVKND